MAETRIPVDVFNPGQVFACLGLVEAADILLGDAAGAFHWQNATRAEFILRAAGENDPLHAVLAFLKEAEVLACVPEGSPHGRKRPKARSDGQPMEFEIVPSGHPFPSPDEGADRLPAILRASFGGGTHDICISYWAEPTALTGRDNVKFWAGAGGYPGVALLKDALNLMHEGDRWQAAADDPFNIPAPQSSSFRFDWRRDYVPLDTGFSLNRHGHIVTVGYPLVEVLAAIGLTHARPLPQARVEGRPVYTYGIVGGEDAAAIHPPPFLRAALGCAALPFPMRVFRMFLDWPGQEGQARCITNVIEET